MTPCRHPALRLFSVPIALGCFLSLASLSPAFAQVIITEFMAANRTTLSDEDGNSSDWIEVYNPGTNAIDLAGWFLTDNPDRLTKWRFPNTLIEPGGYLVLFASGKDRSLAGSPLHTSFQLNADGEFLALVKPDGVTIASQFAPMFPRQLPDVAYGLAMDAMPITLVTATNQVRVYVPTNESLGLSWTGGIEPFDDSTWISGSTGVGFDDDPVSPPTSLDGHWKFDNNASDSTARHSPAILSGASYNSDVPAALGNGQSLRLDGINDSVNLGDVGLSSGSLCLWIKPTDVGAGAGDRRLLSQVSGAVAQGGALSIDPAGTLGNGSMWIWSGSQWLRLCADNSLRVNQWQHLGVVFVNGRVTFYLDGVRQNEVISSFQFNGTSMVFGAPFLNQHGNRFAGSIDDISVWSAPLDEQQIAELSTGALPLDAVSYLPFIGTDLASVMLNISSSAYVRVPFTVEDSASLDSLLLQMQYDDGFVAWLNGTEIARRNAPDILNATSSAATNRPAQQALLPESIDLTSYLDVLRDGTNLLAIQGLNVSAADSDFLSRPELLAEPRAMLADETRYFVVPTPGGPNGIEASDVAPVVTETGHWPPTPGPADDLFVTARVTPSFQPVTEVTVHYRVMFGPEMSMTMSDDGTHGDGASGDGVYGAILPAGIAAPDEMLRYRVVAGDAAGRQSSWPLFNKATESPQYLGTVVANPAVTSQLPILHWFVENESAAATRAGTQASVFFLGEFYDNMFVRVRGVGSSTFAKPSQKFDFNPGYHFRYATNAPRAEEFNLITTYGDPSYLRELLAYEIYRDAGAPASDAFMMRVQRNGEFYSVDTFVEQPDDEYLAHHGLDPQGALYKMYNSLENPINRSYSFYVSDNSKRTREWEDFSDLTNLVAGVSPTNSPAARERYLFDHVNLPAMISYLAATVIAQDLDHETHNYFAYRDTEGSGEWLLLPWDRNFSFGVGNSANSDPASHPFLGSSEFIYPPWQFLEGKDVQWNRLTDAIYDTPRTREMFLRRLRTLMDALLEPNGIPDAQLRLSQRIQSLVSQMQADVTLDNARWSRADFSSAVAAVKSFLVDRRVHLYVTHSITNLPRYSRAAGIPLSQQGNPPIAFRAMDVAPLSGIQDEQYIELLNSTISAVDISGWHLSGPVQYTFLPGAVIPAGGSVFVSPNVARFRARTNGPGGSQGLFVQGNYAGHLSDLGEAIYLTTESGALVATGVTPGLASPDQYPLRITEIMYHPHDPPPGSPYDAEAFEYVELRNIGDDPLELAGFRLGGAVRFEFTAEGVSTLEPGERVVVVRDLDAFLSRYPDPVKIAGVFAGELANSGDRLRLEGPARELILDFRYDDDWYPITDGLGFSLVTVDDTAAQERWAEKSGWQVSGELAGSPGREENREQESVEVLVNELSTHQTSAEGDAIELYNPLDTAVDISGWFLTDDFRTPRKFHIPTPTVIQPGGYVVFSESQFNAGPDESRHFGLSSRGDEVYLFSGNAEAMLSGYVHGFEFGPSDLDVTFGRHVDSIGREHVVAQVASSIGDANAGPLVGPVVISEIMYHPLQNFQDAMPFDDVFGEFVEIQNLSRGPVPLFVPSIPTVTWALRGAVEFSFPSNVLLAGGGYALVVSFDPANQERVEQFRTLYGLSESVPIFGPYQGKLSNSRDSVELYRPRGSELSAGGDEDSVPEVLVDRVEYEDTEPWPVAADGVGSSLQRVISADFGNDPGNWVAAAPSPGRPFTTGDVPEIVVQPRDLTLVAFHDAMFDVVPSGTGPFRYQWRFDGGNVAGATNATLIISNVQPWHAGEYRVVVLNAAGTVASRMANMEVLIPATITRQPVDRSVKEGLDTTFEAIAVSTTPMRYQWRKGNCSEGVDIAGATNRTLTLTNLQVSDQGLYTVEVTDDIGPVCSVPAELTVLAPVRITRAPQSLTAVQGDDVSFFLIATANPLPITYRWRKAGRTQTNYSDTAYSSTYTIYNVQPEDTGRYDVVVANEVTFGVLSRPPAILTVLEDSDGDHLPDVYETAERGLNPNDPDDAELDFDGDGLTNRQEYIAGTDLNDEESFLQVEPLEFTEAAAVSFLAVSNRSYTVQFRESLSAGRWTWLADVGTAPTNRIERIEDPYPQSGARIYRLVTPQQAPSGPGPTILQSPVGQEVLVGTDVELSVVASGVEPLEYQWWFDGEPLFRETNPILTLPSVQTNDIGNYKVTIRQWFGTTESEPAYVNVLVPPDISQPPESQSVLVGQQVTLRVRAAGFEPLIYRWYHNGALLEGATGPELILDILSEADGGRYTVAVRHETPFGPAGVFSQEAVLVVAP